MNESPLPNSPIGHLLRKPTGGVVRNGAFAAPPAPIEVQIARLNLVKATVPYVVIGAAAIGSMFILKSLLTASPNTQMVQAQREMAVQNAEAIKQVARSSGCNALICVNVGRGTAPETAHPIIAPTPDTMPVVYDPERQAWIEHWSKYWGHTEFIQEQFNNCVSTGWAGQGCSTLREVVYQKQGL